MVEKLLSDVALEHTHTEHLQSKISQLRKFKAVNQPELQDSLGSLFQHQEAKIPSILAVIGLDHKIGTESLWKTTTAVSTGFSDHDRLVKMLDKLTVRNNVMDLLLTLFLLARSLNEVPGRNNAVQNVFTFSQTFETRLQGTPIALELAALSQVGSR
ncbi:hypothetical protein BASA62_010046 [Batrachochytrium salamandrivorans]|nr:hypothetical protein BASA62_010046 [Batrachochytrium salamandrivorans]